VFVARNGVFLEKEFLSKGVSGSKVQLEEIRETPENVSAPTELVQDVVQSIDDVQDVVQSLNEIPAPRRSTRKRRVTQKFTLLTTKHQQQQQSLFVPSTLG
jgi:hypothetical protein